MYTISVPATSANLGPGFDAIGIALNLYNEMDVKPASRPLYFTWEDENDRLSDEENLIYQSVRQVFASRSLPLPNAAIHVRPCRIPICRGLGSSSAAIVSGLAAACLLLGEPPDKEKIAKQACLIEGHPDNVIPAVYGGLSVTILQEGRPPLISQIDLPSELRFMAVIPPYRISTEESRRALPAKYARADCIHNAARTALLVNALYKRDYALLRTAFEDAIHHPYRLPLMPDAARIFDLLQQEGSLGEFISGSGSTLIGVFTQEEGETALAKIQKSLHALDPNFTVHLLEADQEGLVQR
ncbi:MAG: homoserine kinase [Peptostreptococcaceae bacterium]|nr:homoserine kinase [Peptostreptococcaceae bacterium]